MLLGELYLDIDPERAKHCLVQAATLAKTSTDRQTINRKLDQLGSTA